MPAECYNFQYWRNVFAMEIITFSKDDVEQYKEKDLYPVFM